MFKYLLFLPYVHCILTQPQWRLIEKSLVNPSLSNCHREYIQDTIFNHYRPFAYKECSEFMKFHRFKTRHVNKLDLRNYALFGLHRATVKYNGKYNFAKYAQIYIEGSLYNGLSKMYPINKYSSKERRRHIGSTGFNGFDKTYERHSVNMYLGKNRNIPSILQSYPLSFTSKEFYIRFWRFVNELDPFVKRIIYLKFDYNFDVLHSNKRLSLLCGCSEETVRKNVHKTIMNFTSDNIYNDRRCVI